MIEAILMLIGVFVGLVLLRIAMQVVLQKGAQVIIKTVNPQAQFTSIYKSQLIKCPQCATDNQAEAKFCTQCGNKIEQKPAPVQATAQVARPESRPLVLHDNSVYLPPESMQYAMDDAGTATMPKQETCSEVLPGTEFANKFGVILKDQVVCYENMGWFDKGMRKEIMLSQVTAAEWSLERQIRTGQILFAVGLFTLTFGIGIPIMAFGILLYWGSAVVVLKVAGSGQDITMKSWPWERSDAQKFAEAVRSKLAK